MASTVDALLARERALRERCRRAGVGPADVVAGMGQVREAEPRGFEGLPPDIGPLVDRGIIRLRRGRVAREDVGATLPHRATKNAPPGSPFTRARD